MKKFNWNEQYLINSFAWNTSIDCESPISTITIQSLKERLYTPVNGKRPDDQLKDIGIGIAMIMDYIETKENPVVEERFRFSGKLCPECNGDLMESEWHMECFHPHCKYSARKE